MAVYLGDLLCATKGMSPTYVVGKKRMAKEKIKGVNWYYYLVPNDHTISLFDEVSQPVNKFIVCYEFKSIHLFAAFNGIPEFIFYQNKLQKHFYEIILGERPQKLYFDIDIPLGQGSVINKQGEVIAEDPNRYAKELLNHLVRQIIEIFWEYGHKVDLSKNILIFESKRHKSATRYDADTPLTKYSYHVIVDGYAVRNHRETFTLAQEVLEDIPEKYRCCIDSGVYSKKQQLRLMGSRKFGSTRIKELMKEWEYGSEKIVYEIAENEDAILYNELFSRSCVTHISTCRMIEMQAPSEEEFTRSPSRHEELELSTEMINDIYTQVPPEIFQIYKPGQLIDGCIIPLKRKVKAHCSICKRFHESDNAYLVPTLSGVVFFVCRRNEEEARENKISKTYRVVADLSSYIRNELVELQLDDVVDCIEKDPTLLTNNTEWKNTIAKTVTKEKVIEECSKRIIQDVPIPSIVVAITSPPNIYELSRNKRDEMQKYISGEYKMQNV